VRDADQDQEPGRGQLADNRAVDGDARPADALHDCPHESGFCHGNGPD